MTPSGRDRALRCYRALLRLFPARFRRDRGEAMERLFVDMWTERRLEGRTTAPIFWGRLVWDTVSHAGREWLASPSPTRRGVEARTGESLLAALRYDVRYACRGLARQPLYAGLIVLMMGLAIGGNTAVFRVYNGLFLRPLPFAASERLVDLDTRAPRWNLEYTAVAFADFAAWREGNRTFEAMGVYDATGANFSEGDGAVRVEVVRASHDLAPTLGLEPVVGRLFTDAEDVPDGPRVALLAHGFWTRQYGAEPSVVGASTTLNDVSYEIVGVLPPAASFVENADVWVALGGDPNEHSSFSLQGIGRLAPGVTPAAAEEDLTRIHKGLVERWSVNENTFPVVSSLRDRYLGEARTGVRILLAAVGVVLLLACTNIAGLVLVRAMGRRREVGVRMAMGAGRSRIVRHLLAESLVLAAMGGAVGSALGVWSSGRVVERLEAEFPPWVTFGLDLHFVLFTVVVTGATAVLFGLAPAFLASGTEPGASLQAASGRSTSTMGRVRATNLLVGVEVALACTLLVVAGLNLRDTRTLMAVNPGFRIENVLSYVIQLPEERYSSREERAAFWTEHVERVGALPSVLEAGGTTILPLRGHTGYFFQAEGAPPRGGDDPNPVVLVRSVTPGYLEAMDVRVVSGRPFNRLDGLDDGSAVVAVSETFVREFLGHLDQPIGARIRTGGSDAPWWTVTAVTGDTKHYGLDEDPRPGVFVPVGQLFVPASMTVAVHTVGPPTGLVDAARSVLAEQDPGVAMFRIASMMDVMSDSLWSRRAASWLIVVFASAALMLAVAGVYGVISYGVRQRVHEIGIRMAMGARRSEVAARVLKEGMLIVAVGIVVGMTLALVSTPLLGAILLATSPTDPWVYGSVALLILCVAGVATVLPARQAARMDAMGVLRGD